MEYSNRLKGSVTQALLKSLLADAGYRVVPLGIEEAIREVTSLDKERYSALELPSVLRKMPDFFIADRELWNSWLVEVKFRNEWNDDVRRSLGAQLKEQVQAWSPLYVIMFLGTPAKRWDTYPSAWMGVAKLSIKDGQLVVASEAGDNEYKWDEIEWSLFARIQKVFPKLDEKEKWDEMTLKKTWTLLGELMKLDLLETK